MRPVLRLSMFVVIVLGCATVYVSKALHTEAGRKQLLPFLRPIMRVMNPRIVRAVERGESKFGVLHHIGRRSRVVYQTPVAVGRTPEGVLIPLMYGPETDWCRNIVAAGHCTLTMDGEELALNMPEVLFHSVAEAQLPPETLQEWEGQGIARYLSLKFAPKVQIDATPDSSTVPPPVVEAVV